MSKDNFRGEKILLQVPDGGLKSGQAGGLTVGDW
jgi:hypothetical protein